MKKLWKYFKGKKRNIGIIAGFLLKGVVAFSSILTHEQANFIGIGIDIFLLGGLADNLSRTTKVGQSIATKGKDTVKKAVNLITIKK